jgi:hypothetical protein
MNKELEKKWEEISKKSEEQQKRYREVVSKFRDMVLSIVVDDIKEEVKNLDWSDLYSKYYNKHVGVIENITIKQAVENCARCLNTKWVKNEKTGIYEDVTRIKKN